MSLRSNPPRAERRLGLVYVALGQVGWFTCVLSAAKGDGWIGVALVAAMAAGHLCLDRRPLREAGFLVVVTVLGFGWESCVYRTGWIAYPNGVLVPGFAPYWMAGLWALFALQINPVFASLRRRRLLCAMLGAVGGPLSFRAGAALGAVQFIDIWRALALIGAGWAVMLPGLITLGEAIGSGPIASRKATDAMQHDDR
ncbi:DUF2878 domain-containing protein [Pandoraea sp. 64-18]|uniref:DUF2878 domain-containing protein n=1 Tax=Pandoraea sp. 64-18 TaxID=1895806 RepID=UPI00257E54AB|nr:DUF2878 domain-containing protein [Pandoraea sp. 64-18]